MLCLQSTADGAERPIKPFSRGIETVSVRLPAVRHTIEPTRDTLQQGTLSKIGSKLPCVCCNAQQFFHFLVDFHRYLSYPYIVQLIATISYDLCETGAHL